MENLSLNSFLGIDFGSTQEVAKNKMLSRASCTLDEKNSTDTVMYFYGVTFAGRDTSFVMLLFVNGKFSKAAVYIKPKLDAFTIRTYQEIKEELNAKYFKTIDDFELYDEPYQENDGYTETGISVGKVKFSSFWSFKDSKDGEEDFISLRISEELDIIINYEDGDLTKELVNKIKDQDSEDY